MTEHQITSDEKQDNPTPVSQDEKKQPFMGICVDGKNEKPRPGVFTSNQLTQVLDGLRRLSNGKGTTSVDRLREARQSLVDLNDQIEQIQTAARNTDGHLDQATRRFDESRMSRLSDTVESLQSRVRSATEAQAAGFELVNRHLASTQTGLTSLQQKVNAVAEQSGSLEAIRREVGELKQNVDQFQQALAKQESAASQVNDTLSQIRGEFEDFKCDVESRLAGLPDSIEGSIVARMASVKAAIWIGAIVVIIAVLLSRLI